jgi:hypothetical protein
LGLEGRGVGGSDADAKTGYTTDQLLICNSLFCLYQPACMLLRAKGLSTEKASVTCTEEAACTHSSAHMYSTSNQPHLLAHTNMTTPLLLLQQHQVPKQQQEGQGAVPKAAATPLLQTQTWCRVLWGTAGPRTQGLLSLSLRLRRRSPHPRLSPWAGGCRLTRK